MKKILVPCDFSDQSKQAFKFAMDIAAKSLGEVQVLYIIDIPYLYETTFRTHPSWHDPNLIAELSDLAKKEFQNMISPYANGTVPVSLMIERGPVTSMILKLHKDQQNDLIIMGKEGANDKHEFLMGSNSGKVVRAATVPVLVVKQAPDTSAIRNIVYPSTLDMDQVELISHIKVLQEFFSAILHIVLINTPNKFMRDREAKGALEEYAKHYKIRDYTLNFRSDPQEYEGIINFALEKKADMIAMRTHGRKGISHLLNGSVAEDVISHVSCPVWTFAYRH
jgi:nucleotide-binding universal stress UspA family protein